MSKIIFWDDLSTQVRLPKQVPCWFQGNGYPKNLNPRYQLPTSGPSDQLPLCQVGGGVQALHLKKYYPVSFLKKAYILEIEQQYIPKMMVFKKDFFSTNSELLFRVISGEGKNVFRE